MNNRNQQPKLAADLSQADRDLFALLNDLPAVAEPFNNIAKCLNRDTDHVLKRIDTWTQSATIKSLRPFFDYRRLGYESTLAAMAVDAEHVDAGARVISQQPWVSHNFLREGAALNLWFTLTCPTKGPTLDKTLTDLSHASNMPIQRFDTVKHFKISFHTLLGTSAQPQRLHGQVADITADESLLLSVIDALQTGLPVVNRPFETLAKHSGVTESEMLTATQYLKQHGVIRRLGASWNLNKLLGVRNVMCLWNVPDEQTDALGQAAAACPQISHAYLRTHTETWPWKLYTVIHGSNRNDCLTIIDRLSRQFPNAQSLPLWTVKPYKHTPIRYERERITLTL